MSKRARPRAMRLGRFRISVRLATIALFAVVAVAALTIAVATAQSADRHARASDEAGAAVERIALYEDALGSAYDEWVSVIGYFTQSDPQYIVRFSEANSTVDSALASQRKLAQDDATRAELDRLIKNHEGFVTTDLQILQAIGNGDLGRALTLSKDTDLYDESDAFLQTLRTRISDERVALQAAQQRQRDAEAATRHWSLGVGGACALLLILVGSAAFHWIGSPLDKARKATRSIASGDLSVRVRRAGPAELAGLAEDVNAMADALIRRSEEINAYLSRDLETRTEELEQSNTQLAREVEEHRLAEETLARTLQAERALEDQLRHQAFHDSLTGLANRARFTDRLDHALQRTVRSGERLAVFFMDLDDFKSVNDSLGHQVGDALLIEVAARLTSSSRAGDTVARLGGDEFAVLLEGVHGTEAEAIATRLIEAFRSPFALADREVYVRASIGIAPSHGTRVTSDELLRRADIAMYAAKSDGKGRFVVYDPAMERSMVGRMQLASDLQGALDHGELEIHYQPTIELQTERIVGVEALLRWHHPVRGLIGPSEFIPLAEETGLIIAIGRWILRQACLQARAWQEASTGDPLTLSVNVSARQIHQVGFVDTVRDILEESELPPATLVLEITESVVMQDAETAINRLAELKSLGVRLALDDFGTGYSSLSYLRRFPVDILKIDKSFVDGVREDGKERELAQSIIELGQTLDLQVVAEGIEHAEQIGWLRSQRCELGQGFLFSEPVEANEIERLLDAAKGERAADAA